VSARRSPNWLKIESTSTYRGPGMRSHGGWSVTRLQLGHASEAHLPQHWSISKTELGYTRNGRVIGTIQRGMAEGGPIAQVIASRCITHL